jgi:hypothetical protein
VPCEVGEEDLVAVAVNIGEGELGAGMGLVPAGDGPGARRPGAQVNIFSDRRSPPGGNGLGTIGDGHRPIDEHPARVVARRRCLVGPIAFERPSVRPTASASSGNRRAPT